MALRFLLLSLVAGMGLELPSGQEWSGWTRAGREWAGARMVELSSIRSEAGRVFLGATDCGRAAENAAAGVPSVAGESTGDLTFDVVVEGMAASFAADLTATRSVGEEPGSALEVVVEQPRGEDPPTLAWTDPEPEPTPFDSTETPAIAGRVDRLSAAVRLTRQALAAWALLIEGSADVLTDAR